MTPQRLAFEVNESNAAEFKNIYLDTDYGQLDCLSEVQSLGGFDAVAAASEELDLPAGKCRILSIDALIRAKEAMGQAPGQLSHPAVARNQATDRG